MFVCVRRMTGSHLFPCLPAVLVHFTDYRPAMWTSCHLLQFGVR